jgi:hypothetical protein
MGGFGLAGALPGAIDLGSYSARSGGHLEIPAFEADSWQAFFARQLI